MDSIHTECRLPDFVYKLSTFGLMNSAFDAENSSSPPPACTTSRLPSLLIPVFPMAAPLSLPASEAGDSPSLVTTLRPLYIQFFKDLELTQPFERFQSEKLMEAVLEFARGTGVPHPHNSHSYESLMVGYSYADVSHHP
jgi:hypothetical protein